MKSRRNNGDFHCAWTLTGSSFNIHECEMLVAPKSVKTPLAGADVASSALSPSRSVDSQLNNLSVTVSTPVGQSNTYVTVYVCLSSYLSHTVRQSNMYINVCLYVCLSDCLPVCLSDS